MRGWDRLHPMSKALYEETYFLPNENYEGWLDRVARAYQNDEAHGTRMKGYISNYWFHPSTPPSSNAGTDRGLPISCFTKSVYDDKPSIFSNYNEAFNLGAFGGGIGTDWSKVREINHAVGTQGGTSSGIIPFMGISDRSTLAISQGNLRRASEAVYLGISHPEIEEFIDLRKPTGDQNRRAPNLHHGVVIPDSFMNSVIYDKKWDLVSPKDGTVIKTVKARKLWTQLLEVRQVLRGEPYLLFIDTVNELSPEEYKHGGIKVSTSNLCTEITLRTDEKHSGVCCLGSINLEYWDEYLPNIDEFIADCTDYLDNILQDFIDRTEGLPGFERARAGAIDERSIGLGVMGFHSYLQSKMIPWESAIAKGVNLKIFKQIKESADKHNRQVGFDGNYCPMSERNNSIDYARALKRNIHVTAIAPTMSISSLMDVTSSGIEAWVTNAFTKKVKQGSFSIKNKYLDKVLDDIHTIPTEYIHGETVQEWRMKQWDSIKKNNGSVQHLDWMDQNTKDVFKTAFEIDQRWVIEMAGDRQQFIDQAQSLNLFIPGGSHVQYISDLHILAWKKKVKSLYYLRSSVVSRASTSSNERKHISKEQAVDLMSDTCIGCA
jgi:ribonucleoside-diphosphate reductase alpha chain